MQPDLRTTVRRITPALLAFSAYMVFYPAPAEACHKYVSPYTGKTGCGARREDRKKNDSGAKTSKNKARSKTDRTTTVANDTTGQNASGGSKPGTQPPAGRKLPWPSGFACPNLVSADEFARWRGTPVDVLGGWSGRKTWRELSVNLGGPLKRHFVGKAPMMVIGLALLAEESKGDFLGCARGKYDKHFRKVAKKLKQYTSTKKIIRLGWEPNGSWYPWSVNGNYSEYRSCFRHVVNVIRSVDQTIEISWSLAKKTFSNYKSFVYKAYPGNAYVDYIDLDFYDHHPPATTQDAWNKYFQPQLDFFISFAKENGKKFGFGEWGLSNYHDEDSGGDNPLYIRNMYAFLKKNASMIGYEVYFNCGSRNAGWRIYPSNINPIGSAEYRKLW